MRLLFQCAVQTLLANHTLLLFHEKAALVTSKLLLDAAAESQPLRKDKSGCVLPLTKAVKQDKLEHASAIEASITGNESPHDIQKRRNIGD